jgi:hypothetical protein
MAKYAGIEHELPDINSVWVDKKTYPYAVIIEYVLSLEYVLLLSETPFVYENGFIFGSNAVGFACAMINGDTWYSHEVTDNKSYYYEYSEIWTSHDIYNTDGSVYLAASEPIPLAEAYTSYVHNGTWQKGTFYKRVNNAWVKHQAYKRQNGAWVKVKE